jgi:hypothetical protein
VEGEIDTIPPASAENLVTYSENGVIVDAPPEAMPLTPEEQAAFEYRRTLREAKEAVLYEKGRHGMIEAEVKAKEPKEKPPRKSRRRIRIEVRVPSIIGERQRAGVRDNPGDLTDLENKVVETAVSFPLGTKYETIAEAAGVHRNTVENTFKKRAANNLVVQLMLQKNGLMGLHVLQKMLQGWVDPSIAADDRVPARVAADVARDAANRAGHDSPKIFIDGEDEDF